MAKEVDVNIRAVVKQGLSVLILCTFVGFASGFTLQEMERYLHLLPALALMIPPMLDMKGNIHAALASRLGSALHTGVIESKLRLTAEVKANLVASLLLAFLTSATIGGLAWMIGVVTGKPASLSSLMGVAVIAGSVSSLVLALITVLVAVLTYLCGWDPDNVTPLMTIVGDFLIVVCMYLTVLLVGVK